MKRFVPTYYDQMPNRLEFMLTGRKEYAQRLGVMLRTRVLTDTQCEEVVQQLRSVRKLGAAFAVVLSDRLDLPPGCHYESLLDAIKDHGADFVVEYHHNPTYQPENELVDRNGLLAIARKDDPDW